MVFFIDKIQGILFGIKHQILFQKEYFVMVVTEHYS